MLAMNLVHILFGTTAVFAGVGAFATRKGSAWHRRFGRLFAVTMIATALAGVGLAAIAHQAITALAGVLATYLVLTGWISVRSETTLTQVLQAVATIAVIVVAIGILLAGFLALNQPTGEYQGFAAGDYFYLAAIAILAAGGDLYWYACGGYVGKRRIARHLWRMSTGMLFATGSLFTGPGAVVFPESLQASGLLALPELTILVLLVYWLVKYRYSLLGAEDSRSSPSGPGSSGNSTKTAPLR